VTNALSCFYSSIVIGGKRNSIIVPATGLKDLKRLFDEMAKESDKLQPANSFFAESSVKDSPAVDFS